MAAAGYGDRVEGIHAVTAAFAAGRVVELIVESGRDRRAELVSLIEAAAGAGVRVSRVPDVRELAATSAPQGVLAHCRPISPVDLETLVGLATPASLIVLDHIEDAHNLGAVARSAVAAGVPRLVVPGRRNAPLGAASFKAAAGALERCLVAVVSSVADAVAQLRAMEVWTVGLDAGGDRSLFGLDLLAHPVAVVVGGETGLHRLVRERVDLVASIPMVEEVESLNASVAAALAAFEIARVRSTV